MNDLAYRDWMKFQKSFFRCRGPEALIHEWIAFFTKAVWPDGRPSRSLIVGLGGAVPAFDGPRQVEVHAYVASVAAIVGLLESRCGTYDFALVDLRSHVVDSASLSLFLERYSRRLSAALAKLVGDGRYCCVIAEAAAPGGGGFPIPWSVALACRDSLRLRDERIGLVEDLASVFYCMVLQNSDEKRPATLLGPDSMGVDPGAPPIPAWLMPKPPPRTRREVLHPAKYPESLVSAFLELFTEPGATVLDPMVGTGSTVVAAMRAGRHGIGIELSQEFAQIAAARVSSERAASTLDNPAGSSTIVQGDATELTQLAELRGLRADYCITSPPYWSMLTNPGSENQEARRKKNLKLCYSADERDLGNITDYEAFLATLVSVYAQVADALVDGGVLTVVVKNVKRDHIVYPLAWDLAAALCGREGRYDYMGVTVWCQDDVSLKPFAVGIHWVSNIHHHYCLHFRKRR